MLTVDLSLSDPYAQRQSAKEATLLSALQQLTEHHRSHCAAYSRLLHFFYDDQNSFLSSAAIPYLPVSLFKTQQLLSIPSSAIFKVLYSSGTTHTQPSQIF